MYNHAFGYYFFARLDVQIYLWWIRTFLLYVQPSRKKGLEWNTTCIVAEHWQLSTISLVYESRNWNQPTFRRNYLDNLTFSQICKPFLHRWLKRKDHFFRLYGFFYRCSLFSNLFFSSIHNVQSTVNCHQFSLNQFSKKWLETLF